MGGIGSGGRRHRSRGVLGWQAVARPEGTDASAASLEPPPWLPEAARAAFEAHRVRLEAERLITARDGGSLLVVAVVESVLAALAGQPALDATTRAELLRWLGLYRLALGDIGATPAARHRVEPVVRDDVKDPFAEFLDDASGDAS